MPYCATDMPTDKQAKMIKSFIPLMSYLHTFLYSLWLALLWLVLQGTSFRRKGQPAFIIVTILTSQSNVSKKALTQARKTNQLPSPLRCLSSPFALDYSQGSLPPENRPFRPITTLHFYPQKRSIYKTSPIVYCSSSFSIYRKLFSQFSDTTRRTKNECSGLC